jgi:hypothetical protein
MENPHFFRMNPEIQMQLDQLELISEVPQIQVPLRDPELLFENPEIQLQPMF